MDETTAARRNDESPSRVKPMQIPFPEKRTHKKPENRNYSISCPAGRRLTLRENPETVFYRVWDSTHAGCFPVIPAKAGIQFRSSNFWIPACAGMTRQK
jgi:hypothetical protein